MLCGGPTEPRPYTVVDNGGTYSQYVSAPFRYARRFRDYDIVVDVINGMPYFSPLWRRGPRLAFVTHVHTDQWAQYFPASGGRDRQARRTTRAAARLSQHTLLHDLAVVGVRPRGARRRSGTHPRDAARRDRRPSRRTSRADDASRRSSRWAGWRPTSASTCCSTTGPGSNRTTGGRLVIVGDGPERDRLAARIRTEPALRNVVLEGKVSEAAQGRAAAAGVAARAHRRSRRLGPRDPRGGTRADARRSRTTCPACATRCRTT